MASYRESYTVSAPVLEDYEAKELPSYQAQEDKVNQTYDAKEQSSLAALETAYNQNMMDANATLEKIPATYRTQRNNAEAEYEKQRKAFAEYAANSGVSSGAGSQAQLAYSNQLQNDLNDIGVAQAQSTADAQLQISKIKQEYQDSIAQAKKENDYERAAALLAEYQKQAQSIVDVAQAQADEYYRAWQSQLANREYLAEWERTADAEAYQRALEQAETLAAYGDFSGYGALGYSADQIATMQAYWNAANTPSYSGGSSRSSGGGSGGGGTPTINDNDNAGTTIRRNYKEAYNAKQTNSKNKISSSVSSPYAAKDAQVSGKEDDTKGARKIYSTGKTKKG